ncbi:MAG: RagB/SusD family nutrient uptake outer membrane protein [Gemmatimonadales bacterium]
MRYSGMKSFGLGALLIATITSCDLGVSNPGPVNDGALDDAAANDAIVNGMGRALSRAVGYISYTGGIIDKEIVASGSNNVSIFGVSLKQRAGLLDPGLDETNDHWRFAQQARWVSEDGVRRMRETLGANFSKSPLAAQALVHAGFSERLLGENMCVAVIDGGAAEPRNAYFSRAEAAFTEAIAVANAAGNTTLERAARAGRASVRVWLNDWTGAAADARLVPTVFVYQAVYSSLEQAQYNRVYWANGNQPARAHSVVGTFYESYYTSTKDPRTPWSINPAFPRGTSGNVLWYFQTKFDKTSSPVNLVSAREMKLIIAESLLRSGDWPGALTEINAIRASVGVPPWAATNVAETWTALGRERGIELWLEGRRLGDLYRWQTGKVPGVFDDMTGRDMCFPVGVSETTTNPNL